MCSLFYISIYIAMCVVSSILTIYVLTILTIHIIGAF